MISGDACSARWGPTYDMIIRMYSVRTERYYTLKSSNAVTFASMMSRVYDVTRQAMTLLIQWTDIYASSLSLKGEDIR